MKKILFTCILILFLTMSSLAVNVRINLRGAADGFIYHHGDRVDMSISLSRPAHLIVYALNMDGEVRILFPNADTRSSYVTGRSVPISRYYNLLGDMNGPLFIFAIASPDRRLSFRYGAGNVPVWSHHWGQYHPNHSFVGNTGFGSRNTYQVVLNRSAPITRDSGNRYRPGDRRNIPHDQIRRDFRQFDRIIDYFINDLNNAVSRFRFDFGFDTSDLYIVSHRHASGIDNMLDSYLGPYGYWVFVDGIRVWRPYVSHRWRPFVNGYWRWSASHRNWIWVSYEPWALAYYYGYWYFDFRHGWVWLPDFEWKTPRVEFYHYQGYIGWRPEDIPRTYQSRIRDYDRRSYERTNPYVFVPSGAFASGNVSDSIISENVFNSRIKPRLERNEITAYKDGVRFLERIMPAENIQVRTIDLEKTEVEIDGRQLEALVPKLDAQERQTLQRQQQQIQKEVETHRKESPEVSERPSPAPAQRRLPEREEEEKTEGPIKRQIRE